MATRTRSLLIAVVMGICFAGEALANWHVGPQIGFQIYHRRAPEETDSVRPVMSLNITGDIFESRLMWELALSYENGVDSFADQNSISDKLYRARLGGIWKPFKFDSPLLGARLGVQYSVGEGVYNTVVPVSTGTLHPSYWEPYLGFIVGVSPISGFGVEEEFTAFYDIYFKAWIFQFAFGVPLK
ncbi:MAG: hypothetical protein HY074_19280 [Deltaproteobacteria bacterium]|nr:hypothetical protein [Deltaproteobacteria bacterium]